jgi:putative aminopeptidase FrvX
MDKTTKLLKYLTEASGVSGYEGPVRKITKEYLQPLGELMSDRIGSLICVKRGGNENPRVMLAGHLDEIGFMVRYITDQGFIKFQTLGGWFDQVLLGQRVVIKTHKGDVTGVIGVKPPHIIPADERGKVIQKKDMYIDIGVTSKEELEETGVRLGDPIIPQANFEIMANGQSYLSKAFDDRVGVALMVSVLEELQNDTHPNTIYAAATVMEETVLGGAKTSADVIDPDVAIILESGIAGDVPGVSPEENSVKLGKGPVILLYDARMIPNLKLRDLVFETANELNIPVQTDAMQGGATDGGMIHLHKSGVPTIVIGVPARHIHSHSSILHRVDYDQTVDLLKALIKKLDQTRVDDLVEI